MKTRSQSLLLLSLLSFNLQATEYISELSPDTAINIDSDAGKGELAALLRDRSSSGDTSGIVVEYQAKYDVTNLQIHLPLVGEIGKVFARIPLIGGLFGHIFPNPNPPRSLTLRGILYPATNPKGFLLGVHGLQSNSRWYAKSGEALAKEGITSLFFDRRGSGMSDSVLGLDGRPMRGHVSASAFDNLLELPGSGSMGDPSEFLEDIHESYQHLYLVRDLQKSNRPIHLYANCFGARVAFAYAGEWQHPEEAFASIITTSPGTNMKKGNIDSLLGRLDVASPIEHYRDIGLVDEDFTSNPEALAEMGDDSLSLSLRQVTNRFLLSAGGLTKKMNGSIVSDRLAKMPALVIIPSRDQIIFTDKTSETFAQNYKGPTLLTWIDSEHMVEFDDAAQRDFVELVSQWIFSQNNAPAGYRDTGKFATQLQAEKQDGKFLSLVEGKINSYR